tara:strand:- start:3384 stop:3530 length:147 start_codon:yes stop_codon:yes gene_type:complete
MTTPNRFDNLDKKLKAIPHKDVNNLEHAELFRKWLHELILETKKGRKF